MKEVNEGYRQMCRMIEARKAEEASCLSDEEEDSMEIESERGAVHVELGAMGV